MWFKPGDLENNQSQTARTLAQVLDIGGTIRQNFSESGITHDSFSQIIENFSMNFKESNFISFKIKKIK